MATIGPVSYPTDTSWTVQVSDLPVGATTLTVSDGVETITTVVTNRIRLRKGSAPAPLHVSNGAALVDTQFLVSNGSTYT